jgi:hypothetical protein
MEVKETHMKREKHAEPTRREVVSKMFFGAVGALFAAVFGKAGKAGASDEFERNISDTEASYYKRLAG